MGGFMSQKVDIGELFNSIKNYFSNLSQNETYAWFAIGLGIVLIIISLIIW